MTDERVDIDGRYQISATNVLTGSTQVFNEEDHVSVESTTKVASPELFLTATFEKDLSSRGGLVVRGRVGTMRADGRVVLSAMPNRILIDDPQLLRSGTVSVGTRPFDPASDDPQPVFVFTNNLGLDAIAPSSLSGPPITRLETFSGSGWITEASLSVGWRFRF